MKKLEDLITTYKDFPKKGIDFKDVLEILQDPIVFKEIVIKMSSSNLIKNSEAIIAVDARGFIFGSAISLHTSKPLLFARKPGKLPGELIKDSYDLEYGKNSLSIQKKALKKYNSYVIVDDLIATGGTVNCVGNLLKKYNKKVVGILTVVELIKFKSKTKLPFQIEAVFSV